MIMGLIYGVQDAQFTNVSIYLSAYISISNFDPMNLTQTFHPQCIQEEFYLTANPIITCLNVSWIWKVKFRIKSFAKASSRIRTSTRMAISCRKKLIGSLRGWVEMHFVTMKNNLLIWLLSTGQNRHNERHQANTRSPARADRQPESTRGPDEKSGTTERSLGQSLLARSGQTYIIEPCARSSFHPR